MTKDAESKRKGPLAGLKVIDLSHVMAGPACTMLLADMGADVVKVEKIPGGDDAHRMLPPAIGDESAAFLMMNRNKRGMAVDLKNPAGRKALLRVLEDADVLVENYRARHDGKDGTGLRNAARAESAADLLHDFRFWAHGAVCGSRADSISSRRG